MLLKSRIGQSAASPEIKMDELMVAMCRRNEATADLIYCWMAGRRSASARLLIGSLIDFRAGRHA